MTDYVYRLFNREGDLLYVGLSNNPSIRVDYHELTKSWWSEVDPRLHRAEAFGSRREARQAERNAITTEGPKYNIMDKPGAKHKSKSKFIARGPNAQYMTLNQFSLMTEIPVSTLRRGIRNGDSPVRFFRDGNRVLVSHAEVNEWVEKLFAGAAK